MASGVDVRLRILRDWDLTKGLSEAAELEGVKREIGSLAMVVKEDFEAKMQELGELESNVLLRMKAAQEKLTALRLRNEQVERTLTRSLKLNFAAKLSKMASTSSAAVAGKWFSSARAPAKDETLGGSGRRRTTVVVPPTIREEDDERMAVGIDQVD